MRKLLLTLFMIMAIGPVYSQDYDLIVLSNGDSIACKIDSISDASIYFKMTSKNNWVHTSIEKGGIAEYQYNAIKLKDYRFKPGTSQIVSEIKSITSIRDIQKNSLYAGYYILALSVIYERTIPVGNSPGIMAGAGLIQNFFETSGSPSPVVKTGIILGGGKHFLEGGIYINLASNNEEMDPIMPELGYRYQGSGGFLFRVNLATTSEIFIIPGISIGFSF